MMRKLFSVAAVLAPVGLGLTANSAYGAGVRVPLVGPYSGTAAFTSPDTVAFSGPGVASVRGAAPTTGSP